MVNKFIDPEIKTIDITDEQLQRMKDLADNHNQPLEAVIFSVIEHGLVALEKSQLASKFQNQVWDEIDKIPHGMTLTYKQLAINIGKPNAARAVANACGKNPRPIKTPCHRVIKSDNTIGGYSGKGGVETKRRLLANEGIFF